MSLHFESPMISAATIVPTDRDSYLQTCGDDSLRRRVLNFLQSRNISGMDELEITADGSTIRLQGVVASQHAKHLCLECCRHVAGVMTVIDNVTVENQDFDSRRSNSSLTLSKRPR